MAAKSSLIPTVAIFTVALFLLVTFYRSNLSPYEDIIPASKKSAIDISTGAAASPAAKQAPIKAPEPEPVRDKHSPRYIFVDLGANGADSLEAFLQNDGAKFQYDFPKPDWAKHKDAEIFLFEANPVFNGALVEAKEKYGPKGISVNIYPSTVVDVKDGTRIFYLDNVNTDHDFWGSSTYANHPDAVKSGAKGTELTAINISRWLLMNTLPQDFVVVKMDIEGAEYDIVPHMAEMGVWSVVDHLLIEWHTNIPEQDAKDKAEAALEVLKSKGIDCPTSDSAA